MIEKTLKKIVRFSLVLAFVMPCILVSAMAAPPSTFTYNGATYPGDDGDHGGTHIDASNTNVIEGTLYGSIIMTGGKLQLYNGFTVAGTINSSVSGANELQFEESFTLSGNIGAVHYFDTVGVQGTAAVDLNSHQLHVEKLYAGNGTITGDVIVHEGGFIDGKANSVIGTINGASAGVGEIHFVRDNYNNANTVNLTASIGATNALSNVIITDGSSHNVNFNGNNVSATTITVGGNNVLISGSGTITGDVIIEKISGYNGSNGLLKILEGATINGTIKGATDGAGDVTVLDDLVHHGADGEYLETDIFRLSGNLGTSGHALSTVYVGAGKVLSAETHDIYASIISLNNNAVLETGVGNAIRGSIRGNGSGQGTLGVQNVFATSSAIGTSNSLRTIHVEGQGDLTVNHNLSATNMVSEGIVNFTDTAHTITTNFEGYASSTTNLDGGHHAISGTFSLGDLGAGAILGSKITNSGESAVNAGNITSTGVATFAEGNKLRLNISGLTLSRITAGTSTYDLIIGGNSSAINAVADADISLGGAFGSNNVGALTFHTAVDGNKLILTFSENTDIFTVADGTHTDYSGTATSISEAAVVVGTGATLTMGSGSITNGNVTLNQNAILNTGSGSSVHGFITGLANEFGTLNVNGGEGESDEFISHGDIGYGHSLEAVHILGGKTLQLLNNGNSLSATTITLGTSAQLIAGAGDITSTNIVLGAGSILVTGDGAITAPIRGDVYDSDGQSGDGTLRIAEGKTFAFNAGIGDMIGDNYGLHEIDIQGSQSNSLTFNIGVGINADTFKIGSNATINFDGATINSAAITDSTAEVSFNQTLNLSNSTLNASTIQLGNTSTINIGANSHINGNIIQHYGVLGNFESGGNGTINISSNFTSNGNFEGGGGTINLLNGADLNLFDNNNSLNRYNVVLSSGSALSVGTGAIQGGSVNGSADGLGSLVVTQDYIPEEIGETHSLNSILVNSGAIMDVSPNHHLAANDITVNGTMRQNDIDSANGHSIAADIVVSGTGTFDTREFASITTGDFTTQSGAILKFALTDIPAGSVSSNYSTIASGTKLYLDIVELNLGGLTAGTSTFTLVSGGGTGTVNAISDANINIGAGYGSNISAGLRFFTSVVANNLVLNFETFVSHLDIYASTDPLPDADTNITVYDEIRLLDEGATLSMGSGDIDANVRIVDGAILEVRTGAVNGTIDGFDGAGQGILRIKDDFATNGNIGSTYSLAEVTIDAEKTLTMSGSNILNSSAINVGSSATLVAGAGAITGDIRLTNAATLVVGLGAINGAIEGAGNSNLGTIEIAQDFSTNGNIGENFSLHEINIADGKTLTVNNHITTNNNINVGSGHLNIQDNAFISNTIALHSGSLDIHTYFTTNGNITNDYDSNNVATINIINGGTLDLTFFNGNQITAGGDGAAININLDNGSTLRLSEGSSAGTIEGGSNGFAGSLDFTKNFTVNKSIGYVHALADVNLVDVAEESAYTVTLNNDANADNEIVAGELNIGNNATLTTWESGILTLGGNISLGSGATLNLAGQSTMESDQGVIIFSGENGTINISDSTIESEVVFNANNSTLNIGANSTINGNIYMSSGGSLVNVNADFTLGSNITGAFGTVIVAADQTLNTYSNGSNYNLSVYAITLNEASTLILGAGALGGTVDGDANGHGRLDVTNNIIVNDDIGNSHKLDTVIVREGAYFNVANNDKSLKANAITLEGGSTLFVGSGALAGTIDGDSDGNGTLTFTKNLTFTSNIGDNYKLQAVILNNAALENAYTVNLNNNNIGVTSEIMVGGNATLVVSGATINANEIYGEEDYVLTISDGSAVTVASSIGGNAPSGTINIFDSTVTAAGGIDSASNSVLNISNSTINAALLIESESLLNINGTGQTVVNGDIVLAGSSYLNVNGTNFATNGNITNSVGTTYVTINDGGTLDLSVHNNALAANFITLTSGSTLKVGSGDVVAAIDGDADGHGILDVAGDFTTNAHIGDDSALNSAIIEGGKTLDLSVHNNSLSASAITLKEGATLKTGSGYIDGTIDGDDYGFGTLDVVQNLTTNKDIGSNYRLGSVILESGKTLDLTVINNSLRADAITLNSGSTLIVGTGELVGNVDGDVNGDGTLEFNHSVPEWGVGYLSTDAIIGSTHKLNHITIADNTRLTTTNIVKADTIDVIGNLVVLAETLGVGNAWDSSTVITLGGGNASGVLFDNGYDGRLDLSTNGSIHGEIRAATDGVGRFNISSNFTNYLGVGDDATKLARIDIQYGSRLTSNNDIGANHIYIHSNAALEYNQGTITGAIDGDGNNEGYFEINNDFATSSAIGSSHSLNSIFVKDGSTLTVNHNISSNNINVRGAIDFTNTAHAIVGDVSADSWDRWDNPTFNLGLGHHTIDGTFETDSSSDFRHDKNVIAIALNDSSSNSTASLTATGHMNIDSYTKLQLDLSDLDPANIIAGTTTYNLLSGAEDSSINAFSAPRIGVNGDYNRLGLFKLSTTVADDVMTLHFAALDGTDLYVGASAHDALVAPINNEGTANNIDYLNVHIAEAGAYVTMGSGVINGHVTLVAYSNLTVGTGDILGTINGTSDNAGTLIFTDNFTSYGNIGSVAGYPLSSHYLSQVYLNGVADQEHSYTVNLNNNLDTNFLEIDSYARLNVNSGVTLNMHDDNLYIEDHSRLSFDESTLNAVNLYYDDAYATVDVSDSTLNFSGDGINMYSGAHGTLNINSGSSINGDIAGGDSTNTININGGFTTNGDITGLATVVVSSHLNLYSHNNSLSATSITLNEGGTLSIGGGTVAGPIDGDNAMAYHGTVNFYSDFTTDQDIGANASLQYVNVLNSSELNLSENDNVLKAYTISLSSNAELIVGAGAVSGNIQATYYDLESNLVGRGVLTLKSDFTLANQWTIGSGDGYHLYAINFGLDGAENNSTININNNVTAHVININRLTTTNVGNEATLRADNAISINDHAVVNLVDGASLIAQNINIDHTSTTNITNATITGAVALDNSSVLNVNSSSAINGVIDVANSSSINFNDGFTTNGNITNSAGTSTITLLNGADLDLSVHNNSLVATSTALSSGSILTIGSGNVTANIDGTDIGYGVIRFTTGVTLTGDIGSEKSVNNVLLQGATEENAYTVALNGDLTTSDYLSIGNYATLSVSGHTINSGEFDNYLDSHSVLTLAGGAVFNEGSSSGLYMDGSHGTINITESTFNGNLSIESTGTLNINASSSINGDINVLSASTLNFNADFTTNGDITGSGTIALNNGADLNLSVHNNSLATTTITLSEYSVLTAGSGDISGAISLGANSYLNTASGAINGTIDGSGDNQGTITMASADLTTNGDIGFENRLNLITIVSELTLDLRTNNNYLSTASTQLNGTLTAGSRNVYSNTIWMGDDTNATLNAGSGDVNGQIIMGIGSIINSGTGAINANIGSNNFGSSRGTLNVNHNLTTNGNVGEDGYSLAAVNVAGGVTLDLAFNNNILAAVNTTLYENSTLKIGTGDLIGSIDGDADGHGDILFTKANTISSNIGSSHKLNAIRTQDARLAGAYAVNFSGDLSAAYIVIGNYSSLIASGSTSTINADYLYLRANSSMTFEDESVFTSANFLGVDDSLATINVNYSTVNSYVEIHGASVLNLDHATINGRIELSGGSTLNINDDFTTNGNITKQYGGTGTIALNNGAYLDLVTHNNSIDTTTITLSADSILNAGAGNIAADSITLSGGSVFNTGAGSISGTIDGNGTLNVMRDFTTHNDIGTNSSLGETSIASGVELDLATNNNSLSTIYTFLHGTLTAGSGDISTSSILMNDGSVLNTGTGAINGDISSNGYTSTYGTVNVLHDLTTNGALGLNDYALVAVNVSGGVTLDLSDNDDSLVADNTTLGDGSILTLGSGALIGNIKSGGEGSLGTVNFTQSLETSANIGSDGLRLDTININTGAALTSNGILNAGTININGTLNTNNDILGAYININGTLNLGNANRDINVISVSGSGTATINAGSGYHQVAGSFTTVAGDVLGFKVNESASGSINSNLATIADETKLRLDISSFNFENINLATTYNLISSSLNSSINAISDSKIDIGLGYGSSSFDGYRFFTSTANNKLVLNLEVDPDSFIVPHDETYDYSQLSTSITKAAIIVRHDGVLSMGSGDITRASTTLDTNATLNTGTGVINGAIDGNANGHGTLNVLHDFTVRNDIGSTHSLNTISIADAATLTVEDYNIRASTINIGSGTSGTLSISGDSHLSATAAGDLAANILLNDNGVLNISTYNNNSINANINGTADELGEVRISHDISLSDLHIGATHAINDLEIRNGANVHLGSSVTASYVVLDDSNLYMLDGTVTTGDVIILGYSSGANFTLGEELGSGATVNGDIYFEEGSDGAYAYIEEHSTVNGKILLHADGEVHLYANSTINGVILGANNNSYVYVEGDGASVTNNIADINTFSVASGVTFDAGSININVSDRIQLYEGASLTTSGNLTADSFRIYDNSTLETSGDIIARTNFLLYDGASLTTSGLIDGGINADEESDGHLRTTLLMGDGATLTLNSGSSFYANIDDYTENAEGLAHGSIIFSDLETADNAAIHGNIGYNYKIASIAVGENVLLNSNVYSVYTDALSLAAGSNLYGSNNLHSSTVSVDTNNIEKGIIGENGQSAIIMDTLATSSLMLTSGLVSTSFNYDNPTVGINGANGSTTLITVGQDALLEGGTAARLSSTIGAVLFLEKDASNHVNITINNKTTGTISDEGGAVIHFTSTDGADASSTLNITNAGSMIATNAAVLINSQYATNITNHGTMSGQISVNAAVPVTVVNTGEMSGGLYLGSSELVSVTNSGAITDDITIGSNDSSSLTMSDGTITGNITMGATNQTITFNGGTFTGDISGYGPEIYFGSVIVNDVAFGRSDATTNIGGVINLTTNENSFMSLNVSSAFTSLTVVGEAIIASSTTLRLSLDEAVTLGSSFTLVDATTYTGTALSDSHIKINGLSSNTFGGFTFSTRVEDNKLILFASALAEATKPVFEKTISDKVYDIVHEVENPTGALKTVQDYITNGDVSTAQKEEVIKSITPPVDRGTNTTITSNNITLVNLNSARLSDSAASATIVDNSFINNLFGKSTRIQTLEPLRDNNIKSAAPLAMAFKGDGALSKAMWIQTFGSSTNQNNTSSGDGYKANSGGLAVGVDQKINNNFTVGLSTSYSQSNIKSNESAKSTAIDTYQASVYTGYAAKSYFLNSSIGLSINNYNSTRSIAIANATAKGSYSGKSYFARAELGKNFKFANDLIITPSLMLTGAHNMVDDYEETGAGTLNLHVKNKNTDFFETRVGLEVSQLFVTQKKTKIRPQASLSYGYDFIGAEQKTTSNFVGQTNNFTATSANIAQGSLKLGTGLGFYTTDDLTVSLNYGLEKRSDYTAHSGWLRMRFGF